MCGRSFLSHSSKMAALMKDTILYSSPTKKAILLSATVLIGSSLPEMFTPQSNFLSDKNNFINQYFVKYSWAWSLALLIPLMTITTTLYTGLNSTAMLRHFGRLLTNHVIWYTMTSSFLWYRRWMGACSNDNISTQPICIEQGYRWNDVDISGHVFLLSFCILVICEEVKAISPHIWNEYNVSRQDPQYKLTEWKQSFLTKLYQHKLTRVAVSLLEAVILFELLLEVVMVTATSLYFHTVLEKFLGLVLSLVLWYGTYRVVYGSSKWVPCLVGDGVLNPQLRENDQK